MPLLAVYDSKGVLSETKKYGKKSNCLSLTKSGLQVLASLLGSYNARREKRVAKEQRTEARALARSKKAAGLMPKCAGKSRREEALRAQEKMPPGRKPHLRPVTHTCTIPERPSPGEARKGGGELS